MYPLIQIINPAGEDVTGLIVAIAAMGILGNLFFWGFVLFLIRGLIRFLKS